MEQAKELVSRINEQVLELLGRHRKLESERSDLQHRNDELERITEELKTEIEH